MRTFLKTGTCCDFFLGTFPGDLVVDFVGTLGGGVFARYVDSDRLADGVEGRGAGALVLGGTGPTHYVDGGHLGPLVGSHRVHPQESAKGNT